MVGENVDPARRHLNRLCRRRHPVTQIETTTTTTSKTPPSIDVSLQLSENYIFRLFHMWDHHHTRKRFQTALNANVDKDSSV